MDSVKENGFSSSITSNGNCSTQKTTGHGSTGGTSLRHDDDAKTNLIVNYLPQNLLQDDLRTLFSSIAEVDQCKLVRDKINGQSLGYGFINYRSAEGAQKAIESLNGLRLQKKTIKVSYARPRSDGIKDANVYVSGLPRSLTQQGLEELFSVCGQIISARIIYDNQTGLSKGVGFVRFDQRQEAELAIKNLDGITPGGFIDSITVKFANTPNVGAVPVSTPLSVSFPLTSLAAYISSKRCGQQGAIHPPAVANRFGFPPSLDCSAPLPVSFLNGNRNCHSSSSALSGSQRLRGSCLFVYNLSQDAEDNILWQLFGPFGAVLNVKVMRDLSTHKCKGYGFVNMASYDDALVAIAALNGYHLRNRVLQVSFKKPRNSNANVASPELLLSAANH